MFDSDPRDCSLPGSSVYGVSQVSFPGGLPFPTQQEFPHPEVEPMCLASPALAGRFFTVASPGWQDSGGGGEKE